MHRLEKLWVSKLIDQQEGAWQPTAAAGKSGANLPLNMGGASTQTGGRNTGEMPAASKVGSRKGSTTRGRGVRERWEQAPKKTALGGKDGADLKLKKLEVKTKETNSMSAKGSQSEEGMAKMRKKKDGSEEATEVESIIQLDGNAEHNGSSDDDDELGLDDDSDDEDSDGSDESSEDEGENLGDELGSDDDISDEDASKLVFTFFGAIFSFSLIIKQASSLIPPMLSSASMTGSASPGTSGSSI